MPGVALHSLDMSILLLVAGNVRIPDEPCFPDLSSAESPVFNKAVHFLLTDAQAFCGLPDSFQENTFYASNH